MSSKQLTASKIQTLFKRLNMKMKKQDICGEIYLMGGAVMCLVFNARPATQDLDAYFAPSGKLRQAAKEIAEEEGIAEDWLNDGVKGFLAQNGAYENYLSLSHLNVFTTRADYLLAMKCLSFRLGAEFFDESDVRFLLRYLNIFTYEKAMEVITQYYPKDKFPQKAFYALEEMLQN